MTDLVQATSVPIIVAIVYGALELYKKIIQGKGILIKIIPIIAVVLGILIGIAAFYLVPDIIIADNVITAILVGGASGLAATGTHQLFKQISKNDCETKDAEEKDAEDTKDTEE